MYSAIGLLKVPHASNNFDTFRSRVPTCTSYAFQPIVLI